MFKDAMKAFFEMKEHEAILSKEGAKKVGKMAIGRFVYAIFDYLIAGGLGIMVVWMNAMEFSGYSVYLATWVYDAVAAYLFYYIGYVLSNFAFFVEKWGAFFQRIGFEKISQLVKKARDYTPNEVDITLAISFRRAADVMIRNGFWGKILGGLLLFGLSVKAIIWEGPETICFLFRKELKTRSRFHLAIISLSAGQAIFGTWLYTVGYEMLKRFLPAETKFWHIAVLAVVIFLSFSLIVYAIRKMIRLTKIVFEVGNYFFQSASKIEKTTLLISILIVIVLLVTIFMIN